MDLMYVFPCVRSTWIERIGFGSGQDRRVGEAQAANLMQSMLLKWLKRKRAGHKIDLNKESIVFQWTKMLRTGFRTQSAGIRYLCFNSTENLLLNWNNWPQGASQGWGAALAELPTVRSAQDSIWPKAASALVCKFRL